VEFSDRSDALDSTRPGVRPAVQGRGAHGPELPRRDTRPANRCGEVSTNDQRKLDEYLNSVPKVEQRLARLQEGRVRAAAGARQTQRAAVGDGVRRTSPNTWADVDILVLAFQTDTTAVCT